MDKVNSEHPNQNLDEKSKMTQYLERDEIYFSFFFHFLKWHKAYQSFWLKQNEIDSFGYLGSSSTNPCSICCAKNSCKLSSPIFL